MSRQADPGNPDATLRLRLLALLEAGDLDAALQAGLMHYPAGAGAADAPLREAQARLHTAWAARERHRLRAQRLQRQADERDARRSQATAPAAAAAATIPALPPAAAAALARARAKAGGQVD